MLDSALPDGPPVSRGLFIVAHPDDIDFGSAGTIATWTAAGVEVVYCLVTSGDAGGRDLTQSFEDRAAVREAEQTEAAKQVGVTDLRFLRFADGRVVYDLELRMAITRVIRQVQPDRVVTMSSEPVTMSTETTTGMATETMRSANGRGRYCIENRPKAFQVGCDKSSKHCRASRCRSDASPCASSRRRPRA